MPRMLCIVVKIETPHASDSGPTASRQPRRGNAAVSVWLASALLVAYSPLAASAGSPLFELFPDFPDEHVAALWLFDETEYPYATLTDAGLHQHDLRLLEGGTLEKGRFGNALRVLPPGHKRRDTIYERTIFPGSSRMATGLAGRVGASGLLTETKPPHQLVCMFQKRDWTCEFWLKLACMPELEGVILDLGQGLAPGFELVLTSDHDAFAIRNAYGGQRAECPVDVVHLTDGRWHHLAFVWALRTRRVSHFIDGRYQGEVAVHPLKTSRPAALESNGHWAEVLKNRFNISVGHGREADRHLIGMIDELRLSDVVRYEDDFRPATHSRNHGPGAMKPAARTGPSPLFDKTTRGPLRFGARKHVFIDTALVEISRNVELVLNPPTKKDQILPKNLDLSGGLYVFDLDGVIHLVRNGRNEKYVSRDGIHFERAHQWGKANGISVPMHATVFRDENSRIKPAEQYKMTANVLNRGCYLYLSPDGVHWRRNEVCMLPLTSGGAVESFWDDQAGRYQAFIKKDGSFHTPEYPRGGRSAPTFLTRDALAPWPFRGLERPYFEAWAIPCVTGEGEVVIDKNRHGQVYRTRAIKYPWAPDVYLAFVWRMGKDGARQTDLGVSRDGADWRFLADQGHYLASGGTFAGQPIVEALAAYGLIRRGNEIWQYATYGNRPHGPGDRFVRLSQRLDGFTSLDAGDEVGTVLTHPLVFDGQRLALNVSAGGYVKVGILDQAGKPLRGFAVEDCVPVRAEAVRHVVRWSQGEDIRALAGKAVRLCFQMRDAKLFALEFVDDPPE